MILRQAQDERDCAGRPACELALAPLRPHRIDIGRALVMAGAGMRFGCLTGWPCTTWVSPLAETGLGFDVHDTMMEHGCGIGQWGGVICVKEIFTGTERMGGIDRMLPIGIFWIPAFAGMTWGVPE